MPKRTRIDLNQLALDLRVKRCPCCQRELPGWDFKPHKGRRNGLGVYCRPCRNMKDSERYRESPEMREKSKIRSRASYERNIKAVRERGRVWYRANRDASLVYSKAHYRANIEKRRTQYRARYSDPLKREHLLATEKRWRLNNRQTVNAKAARRRARQAAVQTLPFTAALLSQRWAYYANKCWLCGNLATATDHVKPISKGGAHMLCNLRPICNHCNTSKGAKWPFTPSMVRVA